MMMRKARDGERIERAKDMRRAMSPPERAMWKILRGHRLEGWKFTRQVPVGPYFLDFACRRERLGIELDGDSHAGTQEYDARRTRLLALEGWRILRITNLEVGGNPEGVAMLILGNLRHLTSSPRRGEGSGACRASD